MAEGTVVAIEVSEQEAAYLNEKYGADCEVTGESHTLNRLAKKLWGALPMEAGQP